MDKLKSNLFVKIIVFVLLQVCLLSAALSVVVVVINADNNWYSSTYKTVKEEKMQAMCTDVMFEIHDGLYYEIENNRNDIAWPYYLLKSTELPKGIGYDIQFKNINESHLKDIAQKRNVQSITKDKGSYYKDSLYNDLYSLTVYVADPEFTGESVYELYPEDSAQKYELMSLVYQWRINAIVLFVLSLTISVLLVAFMGSSFKRDDQSWLSKIPIDIIWCLATAVSVCAVMVMDECFASYNMDVVILGFASMIVVISSAVTGALLVSVYRIKCGHWWKNALIYHVMILIKKLIIYVLHGAKHIVCMVKRILYKIPLVWKTVLVIVLIMVSNFAIAMNLHWSGFAFLCWAFGAVLISAGVVYTSLCMRRLKIGGEKLAGGDLEYKIEKKGLFLDFADHADNLNSIGKGMAAAVHEKLKSERFKAELITNVSHDIKTPLTSIINYVDLLKKENIEDEKINEYIEVLDRQSSRLKKLTEDIVDASKASTGNVKIDLSPCKVGLLISQTVGDYKDKAEKENLDFIIKLPEDDLEILADGRRLWRVFDNLLNNICKYSQPGTRVYLTLEESDGKAVVTYRNVSKYELDITEEELMERFVRGDKSRNTEGSGLGLSIARNLVELQGGEFDIVIDGDLFKVIIKFDALNL